MINLKNIIRLMKKRRDERHRHELELEARQRIRIEGGDNGVFVKVDGIVIANISANAEEDDMCPVTVRVDSARKLVKYIRYEFLENRTCKK